MTTSTRTSKLSLWKRTVREFCCSNVDSTNPSYQNLTATRTVGDNYWNWRRRIAFNQCATTSLDGTEEWADIKVGRFTVYYRDTGCGTPKELCRAEETGAVIRLNTTTDKPADPASLSVVTADNMAKVRYLRSISSARAEMQSLVTLGERRQALRMIQDRASNLLGRLENYPRTAQERALSQTLVKDRWRRMSKGRKVLELTRSISNTWLEYNFGWRQLVRDLDDAARALAEINTRSLVVFVPVGGEGEEIKYSDTVRTSTTGWFHLKWIVQKVNTRSVRYFGKVRVAPTNAQAMQTLGVTLSEYVPTVWELIPYSFLVDYFANVGEVLDGWSLNTGGLMWTQRTERRHCLSEVVSEQNTVSTAFSSNFRSKHVTPCNHRWWRKIVSRSMYSGSFIPSFHFKIPGIGSTAWCNIAALLGKSKSASRAILALLK